MEGAAGGGASAGRAGRVAHSGAAQAESQGPCASGRPAWVQAEGPPRPPPHTDLALRAPRQAQRGPGEGECRPCGLEPWEAEGVPSSSCHVSSVRRSCPDITHSGRHQREHRVPASPATSPKKQTKRKKKEKAEPFAVRPGAWWRFLAVLAQLRADSPPCRLPSPSLPGPPCPCPPSLGGGHLPGSHLRVVVVTKAPQPGASPTGRRSCAGGCRSQVKVLQAPRGLRDSPPACPLLGLGLALVGF